MRVMKVKQINALFVVAALVTAGAVSCQKEDAFVLPVDKDAPLAFVSPGGEQLTKGATPTDDVSLKASHFGLFAYWMNDGEPFSGVDGAYPYLRNREVVYRETVESVDYWACNPTAFWPIGGSMTFFGYAPFMDTEGPVLTLPSSDTQSMPRGRFIQKTDVKEQVDFCLSAPVYDRKKGSGKVPMNFTHALSKVLFFFNLKGERDMSDARRFMVKSLKLRKVANENSFTYGGLSGYRWDELPRSDLSSRTTEYDLSLADGTLSYVPLPYESERESEQGLARYEVVNGAKDGILYLLPQPMTGTSDVEIVVSAFIYDDTTDTWVEDPLDEMEPVTITLPEETVWQPGKTVCYSASLDAWLPIKFNVTLADWNVRVIENTEFIHE